MKTPRRQKFLAFFLAIALSLTLIPAQVLAIEIGQRKESLQIERAEAASAEPAQDAEIVSEIPSGRDAYQKEFLLSNGQRMLAVYPTAVHYQENGQWEEIDNTLRAERQNGSTVYRNTAGAWDVALPAQMDAQQAVSVEQDGYRLSFRFAGSLRRTPGTELYAAATDRAAERHKEGIILVVHIRIQHGILAERLVFADKHNKQHSHAGNGKGQRRIIPMNFSAGSLHRDSPSTI